MSLRGVFITGTGTDVGKSIVAAGLLRAFAHMEQRVLPIKPVQTGVCQPQDGDCACYTSALMDYPQALPPQVCRVFALPASPHLAARLENQQLRVDELCDAVEHRAADARCPVVLEGAGGLMVPLSESESTLDFIAALDARCAQGMPVLVAMHNALGALNHALLTLDALRLKGLTVLGVVSTVRTPPKPEAIALMQDNNEFLRQRGVPVWEIPYEPSLYSPKPAWDTIANILMPAANACRDHWGTASAPAATTGDAATPADPILDWDKAHLWHPYTSATHPLPALHVTRTQGTRLTLHDGRSLVDGMSSWWCALHGYGQPSLVHAVQTQAARMSHVMFGGLTHDAAVTAAQKVLSLLPDGLEHLFWADSGSVAVEVALKMALQYQQGCGQRQRNKILAPLGGYHGDTMGAMSVCDPVNGMHSLFRGVLAQQIFTERPECPFDGDPAAPFDPACLRPTEQAFATHGDGLAAVIIEPIVQGAGGMWFYHPEYLRHLRRLCDAHGVLLVFDEIATGFGRTGKMFAAQWAGVTPDICCVGKALTGGMMTLAATACTADVAQGICRDGQVFMHGPTFMGNALACATAAASLDLLCASDWSSHVARIERGLRQGLTPCAEGQGVRHVRVLGAIGVIETQEPVPVAALQEFFVNKGVWIRPFARLIYVMPPYVSSDADIEQLTHAIAEAVRQGVHLGDQTR